MDAFGLYLVVTDPVGGYTACTEAAVEHGVAFVQLRMKDRSRAEVIRVGREMREITRGSVTRFIVNDDVAVARAVDADGLHLGQTDMTAVEARRLWPGSESKIFGLSTHDESQAAAAEVAMPDYIGVGPVYATPTKRVADPTLGLARAAAIIGRSKLTCVAIGGIDRTRLPHLLAAGIRNFAVVRCVCQDPRPGEAIRVLKHTWAEANAARPRFPDSHIPDLDPPIAEYGGDL
jgi:thiamine-phosphate pyrophosphorylase